MDIPGIGPLSYLLIIAAILALTLILLLITCCCMRRHISNQDIDSPDYQISQLKKRTLDFGVAYAELTFGPLLGKGSQGEVYRATWRGSAVAVKKIDTRKVSPDIVEEFCQEAEIMRRLRHPCLTLFMGVSLEHPHLCIVTEIVNRGSLFDILHDEQAGLTWQKSLSIAIDVCQGMTYLHGHNPPILHRDLKSLNILVDNNWKAKVADFGMTRFSEQGATMTQCGSPLWMAPEMIKNDPYDEKSDVYSFGICLWELYTRQIPYRELGLNPSHLVVKVVREALRPAIPKVCPRAYAKLLEKCWHPNPEKRPTFVQILKVLESFMDDPVITRHKPMSSHAEQVIVPIIEDKKKKKDDSTPLIGESGWKITDKNEVECSNEVVGEYDSPQPILAALQSVDSSNIANSETMITATTMTRQPSESISSINASLHSSSILKLKPRRPLHLRPHVLYRGKYRGKNVVVRKCKIGTDVWQHHQATQQADIKGVDSSRIWSIMRTMGDLRHPNIVLFMGAYIDYDHVGVVEEDMSRGSLSAIIHDPTVVLEWDTMLQLLIDAAAGMTYLHMHKPSIIHDDLQTSRLLVDHNWRVKISQYGFVNLEDKLMRRPPKINVYHAPELFESKGGTVTEKCNVYSFAMIMWEVLTRKYLYDGKFGPKLRKKICAGHRLLLPSMLSPKFKSLIKACWHAEATKRPTFQQVLEKLQKLKKEGPPKLKLNERNSHRYRKAKTVFAYRSKDPLTILKDWGKNIGLAGSMCVVSEDFDIYMCDPEVFKTTYEPVEGKENEYRKTGIVNARLMEEPFAIKTDAGSIEQGNGGDYLLQNDKGDQWVVDGKTFLSLYEMIGTTPATSPTHATTHEDDDEKENDKEIIQGDGKTSVPEVRIEMGHVVKK